MEVSLATMSIGDWFSVYFRAWTHGEAFSLPCLPIDLGRFAAEANIRYTVER